MADETREEMRARLLAARARDAQTVYVFEPGMQYTVQSVTMQPDGSVLMVVLALGYVEEINVTMSFENPPQ